jgi:hypothetical protein
MSSGTRAMSSLYHTESVAVVGWPTRGMKAMMALTFPFVDVMDSRASTIARIDGGCGPTPSSAQSRRPQRQRAETIEERQPVARLDR